MVVVSGLEVVLIIGLLSALARVLEWSRRRTLSSRCRSLPHMCWSAARVPRQSAVRSWRAPRCSPSTAGRRTDPVPMLALVAALMLACPLR